MKEQKRALITGITGQDGSYLAELLLEKGYEVHGIVRRSSSFNTKRIDSIYQKPQSLHPSLILHYGDLLDGSSLRSIVDTVMPHEVYNLGAQSHVRVSFEMPEYTSESAGMGAVRLLEAIRLSECNAKFYQASSSEMFGLVQQVPQNEGTPFYPRSPYGAAKLYAHWLTKNYRESYGMFAASGILFNHESPRRGETFVTRKITRALAAIAQGSSEILYLGNLDARRDWGYAKDYVEGMWMMLQHTEPDDFVLATGETHSVREFVEETARVLNIPFEWQGKDEAEKGIRTDTGAVIVEIDARYYRPAEVELLIGDPTKVKEVLGWTPKTTFKELVRIMAEADLEITPKITS
ncbi:MAG: GDP-mannose 4,6-dehydratase [Candidatus Paceibacterota bacterium]